MDCDICHRGHDAQRLPFLCAVDARNSLYEGRMRNLQVILENEGLQTRVDEQSAKSTAHGKDAFDLSLAEHGAAEDRTNQIVAAAQKLRDDIEAARDEIRKRKAALARRRSDLKSVADGLAQRRLKQQQDLEKSAQMARFRWSQSAEATANTRAFLCTEAIRLYGLKRNRKGNSGRYEYQIGRVPIVDLTAMDSLAPDVMSTSLAHVAHILVLVCHYLSVRLPAEITLPHRDYPKPTIFNLNSSYQRNQVPFSSTPGASNSPSQSKVADPQRAPRPRPLFIDKPLAQLSKEDPSAYSFFLEGVTLLAYNIAWLCCCQGVSIGDTSSFEDICNMGRNLYSFVAAAQSHDWGTGNLLAAGWGENGQEQVVENHNWLGRYSHGAAFYFLGGPDGTEFTRTFKLPSPMKLADKLRKKLLGDAPGADWEVLDDDAWKVEDIPPGDGADAAKQGLPERTKASEGKPSPRTGSNGWTKVKHRS